MAMAVMVSGIRLMIGVDVYARILRVAKVIVARVSLSILVGWTLASKGVEG